ncbi:MAG TPA: HD domain-containing protein [Phycisphaerae bacterium]|nr:HD domain-containing protein [Phycisphaerae bacterium]
MIRVPTNRIQPGMVLAAPIHHPNADDVCLLKTNYVFEPYTISRLQELGIEYVWIRHPGFEFLDAQIGQAIPESRESVYRAVRASFTGISQRTAGAFELREYQRVVSNMILALVANKDNAVFAERLWSDERELFAHSSNVAYLSLVIGLRIRDYVVSERRYVSERDARDLTNLGIGAMLHDLGKLGMGEPWQKVHRLDEAADCDEYREHARRGYSAVCERVEPTAARILLHHHQSFDGRGFPPVKRFHQQREAKPLEGSDIHIFSRIVCVANILDALIGASAARRLPLAAALAALRKPALQGMFDPVVLDAVYRVVPPFPLSTLVDLSDGRSAVVVDLHEEAPCQPTVRPIDPTHTRADSLGEDIDLRLPGAPRIVAEGGKSTKGYLYTLESAEMPA